MGLKISAVGCAALLFLTGWGHWGSPVKIGLALDHTQGREVFMKDLKEAIEDNRAELMVKDAKDDPGAQESEVKELIQQGIQALVVFPCSPSKAAAWVDAAHQAGIKVISLERPLSGSDSDYLIAFNNEKAGELQAQALVKKVPKGRYVLLGGDPADEVSKELREGQMKVLQPLIDRGNIQIAASRGTVLHETSRGAVEEIEAILSRQSGRVDAVLASNNEAVEGVVQALEKEKLSGKVPIAGLDEGLAACRRIVSGTQTMMVYHPPQKLAEETAYLAAKLARKATEFDCQFVEVDNGPAKIRAVLLTPMAVDTKNLDSTVINDQVEKREAVYGK